MPGATKCLNGGPSSRLLLGHKNKIVPWTQKSLSQGMLPRKEYLQGKEYWTLLSLKLTTRGTLLFFLNINLMIAFQEHSVNFISRIKNHIILHSLKKNIQEVSKLIQQCKDWEIGLHFFGKAKDSFKMTIYTGQKN